ncbi:hypothetical protein GIB67_021519 [Kingdonia uniflora]|uniref:Cytochrome P450 n=1 Tax=Kingdonia uniflora TaxID=39325 RepID=A0A7J7L9S0_9MAGN|nr:hypothetical protein GIB67_021519 [Kingdonia uniflora]
MELLFLSIIFVAALILSCIVLLKYKCDRGHPNLPPGSLGWPFIGETLEFIRSSQKGSPESFIKDRMEKYDNRVFKTSLLGEPGVAVFCGATGNKFLFSNENKLVVTWWPKSVNKLFQTCLITTKGEEGRRMRKMLMTFLNPEALQRYIGTMDTIAQQHLGSHWEGKDVVKVFPLVKMFTFQLACCLFATITEDEKIARLSQVFNVFLKGIIEIPLNFLGTRFYRAVKAANMIRGELQTILEQRKVDLEHNNAPRTQDLLSHMLVTPDESGRFLTEKEIVNNILVLLFAGHDTSGSTITMLVKYLGELPHVYDKLFTEQREIIVSKKPGELLNWDDIGKMKYSWNVVSEVMRLSPPVMGTFREAICDFTYAGYTIPKGWKMYWSPFSTHKDSDFFPDSTNFDPSRFKGEGPSPYTYVPFGGGPRMCIGKEFARLEILVFLHNLVKRFNWDILFPDEKIEIDPMPTPAKGLPIRLRPH